MTFDQWWNRNEMDRVGHADRTSSEEVWGDAQSDVWADVFQVVSDHAHMASREFIRKLEAARETAGYGPATGVAG